jgi:hypothetical protein
MSRLQALLIALGLVLVGIAAAAAHGPVPPLVGEHWLATPQAAPVVLNS